MLGRISVSSKEILDTVSSTQRPLVSKSLLCRDLTRLEKSLKACSFLRKVPNDKIKTLVGKPTYASGLRKILDESTDVRKVLEDDKYSRKVLTIRFSSYDKRAPKAGERFALAMKLLGVKYSGPVGLPTKISKWNVLKSAFKYKRFQESWEIRTWRSVVTVDTEGFDHLTPKIIDYLKNTVYPGVDVKIVTQKFYPQNSLYMDPYLKEPLTIDPITPSETFDVQNTA